jgi:hypothetical protein
MCISSISNRIPCAAGKGTNSRSRGVCAKISKAIEREDIDLEGLKSNLKGLLLSVGVEFFLLEGSPEITNTRFKKDLDNLLKPILNVLQTRLNAATKEELGLGLIDGDEYVGEIHARKSIVHTDEKEGIRIVIYRHKDDDMLWALQTRS